MSSGQSVSYAQDGHEDDASSHGIFGNMFDPVSHSEPELVANAEDSLEPTVPCENHIQADMADTDVDMTADEELPNSFDSQSRQTLEEPCRPLSQDFADFKQETMSKLQELEGKLSVANETIASLKKDVKKLQSTNPAKYRAMDENIKLKANEKSQKDAENKLRAENAQLKKQMQRSRIVDSTPSPAAPVSVVSNSAQHQQQTGSVVTASATTNPPLAPAMPLQHTFVPAITAAGTVHTVVATEMEWEYTG